MRIAVDVDLTVVDLTKDWVAWLNGLTSRQETIESLGNSYSMGDAYKEDLKKFDLCPMDFWRGGHIYDTALPIYGSAWALKSLSEDHEIIFVSKTMGNHGESKKRFLNRFFPMHSGIVFTDRKNLVDCDIFIDDRAEFLNQMKPAVFKILYPSRLKQTEKVESLNCLRPTNWHDIYNAITELTVLRQ